MTWIKTVAVDESEEVRKAVEGQRDLYPIEYATPVHPTADGGHIIVRRAAKTPAKKGA